MKHDGFTRAELVVVIIIVGLLVTLLLPGMARMRESKRRAACVNNLKQIRLAFKMYWADYGGRLPPMKVRDCKGETLVWSTIFEPSALYPDYLTDWDLLVCPSGANGRTAVELWDGGNTPSPHWRPWSGTGDGIVQPCEVVEYPYVYIGWAISRQPPDPAVDPTISWTEEAVQKLRRAADAHGTALAQNPDLVDNDWVLEERIGEATVFYRLARHLERSFLAGTVYGRPQSPRAIMWDATTLEDGEPQFAHAARGFKSGSHVLYLDGHVEFRHYRGPYGDPFPVNAAGFLFDDLWRGHETIEAGR
jgi:prepilin-type processing-associated H-X9-DG protein